MDQLDEYIRFNCPGCGRRLKAKAEHVGKKVGMHLRPGDHGDAVARIAWQ